MAKNTGNDYRIGSVKDRTQCYNPQNDTYVKRDTDTGKFLSAKSDGNPYKGVAKESDGRRK